MKSKFLLSTFLVGLLSFTGCEKPESAAKNIRLSLSNEVSAYGELQKKDSSAKAQPVQGEYVAAAFSSWVSSLRSVSAQLGSLNKLLEKAKPEEKSAAEVEIAILKTELLTILSRSYQMTLYVPSWQYSDAVKYARDANQALQNITIEYSVLFPTSSSKENAFPKLSFDIINDKEVYSTLNDCKRSVGISLVAVSLIDEGCSEIAMSACGHQLDRECVTNALTNFAIKLPFAVEETDTTFDACYHYYVSENVNSASEWVRSYKSKLGQELERDIESCYKTPIYSW